MAVKASDYLDDMVDHGYAMKINYLGTVTETKQIYASQDDFRLRTLIPDVTTVRGYAIALPVAPGIDSLSIV